MAGSERSGKVGQKMFRLLAVLIILRVLVLSALVSVPARAAAAQSLFLSLREGQTAIVAGTGDGRSQAL